MTRERHESIKVIFLAACDVRGQERHALLEARCRGDASLRAEVEALLSHDDESRGPLDEQPSPALVMNELARHNAMNLASRERPRTIGAYQIIDVLGEGGMGVVYLAEQSNPRRQVALKVIRPGLVSPRSLRRFEHEAQLLGRLRHPNIAQVFEAGAAESSDASAIPQPFFAMELVRGQSLVVYADHHQLPTRQRVELMIQVCEAVEHAHQKGVIHRDLKPSNMIIEHGPSGGVVKVLDFGVARATDGDLTATTQRTDLGQLIGTVPYMSPEQIRGDPHELDTRSDVYSLGVVLYELLAGRPPYELTGQAMPQALRIISEDDPTPLSSVNRVFRGDLETIVAKSLEKDRTRRYQSAAGLKRDLERYLGDQPIEARPASAMYQWAKFARRNRVSVVAGSTIALTLLLGAVATAWQAVRATRGWERAATAEALAETRLADATDARDDATSQAARAQAVTQFLTSVLNSVTPETARGRDVSVLQEMLDDAAARIERDLREQPLAQAEVQLTIGSTYWSLGQYDEAEHHLRSGVALRQAALGPDHPDLVIALEKLGRMLSDAGRHGEAEQTLLDALDIGQRQLADDDARLAIVQNALGEAMWLNRTDATKPVDFDRVEQLFRAALANVRRRNEGNDRNEARILKNLGMLKADRREHAEAEAMFDEALTVLRAAGDTGDSRAIATLLYEKGNLRQLRGDLPAAEAMLRESLGIYERILPATHPSLAAVRRMLGRVLRTRGDLVGAESMLRSALEIDLVALGENHLKVADNESLLASVLCEAGRLEAAEPLYRAALAVYEHQLEPGHPWIAKAQANLARVLRDRGQYDASEALLESALATFRIAGADHPDTATCLVDLGSVLHRRGALVAAEQRYSEALAIRRIALPPGHRAIGDALTLLGKLRLESDDPRGAETLLREALGIRESALPPDDARLAEVQSALGSALDHQGRFEEAELLLTRALAARRQARPASHLQVAVSAGLLGQCLSSLQRFEEAEALLLEAHEIMTSLEQASDRQRNETIRRLATLYDAWRKPEQAETYRAQLGAAAPAAPAR